MIHKAGRGSETSPYQLYVDDVDKMMFSLWLMPACCLRMPGDLWVVIHRRVTAVQNGFRQMIKKTLIDEEAATQTMPSATCN